MIHDTGDVICASDLMIVSWCIFTCPYVTKTRLIHVILLFIVPEEISFNPQTKRVSEKCRRAELLHSSVEYIAPSEYMVIYYN